MMPTRIGLIININGSSSFLGLKTQRFWYFVTESKALVKEMLEPARTSEARNMWYTFISGSN